MSSDDSIRSHALLNLGALLALGAVVSSAILGFALYEARAAERFVTVRGLSEREIPADLAFWPMAFVVSGNDLPSLQEEMQAKVLEIEQFLEELGFGAEDISHHAPQVTDRLSEGFLQPNQNRFSIRAVVILRSENIDAVRTAIEQSGRLVGRGISLVRDYEYQTQYLFTKLDEVKPEMIAEATRDARNAAEQFASDSGSGVGAIRRAQQGYFSIQDRDQFTPQIKTVRVVTTVDFFLED